MAYYHTLEHCQTEVALYQFLQTLQWAETVFPLVGYSRTNFFQSFCHNLARYSFAMYTMPFVLEPAYPVLLIILFCFSVGEIPRYLYSFLLVIGKLEAEQTSVLVRLV